MSAMPPRRLAELLAEVVRLRAALAVEQAAHAKTAGSFGRAIELRRQAETTCERRTAEREVARARVDVLERREIELLAERDEALAQLREMAALVNQRADLEAAEFEVVAGHAPEWYSRPGEGDDS